MRRVSSAPNLYASQHGKPLAQSTSGDKLDKGCIQKRTRVHSFQDLANVPLVPIENQLTQYSQVMSLSKGVASALCFEADVGAAPAIVDDTEDLASCLSTPLMEEGKFDVELDIVDAQNGVVIPARRPRRNLTRWDVPSRIAKIV